MSQLTSHMADWTLNEKLLNVMTALVLIGVGWLLGRLLANAFVRTMQSKLTAHKLLLGKRAIFYFFIVLFTISALKEMGFKLSVLLGAAGILTVAIGFASQTSASNLISGLFLVGEGPFAVGDTIQVGSTIGEVMTIDLLSVKLRTPDNLYVRIPNEQLIKSEVINITRFPIRRVTLTIGVAYKEDIARVRKLLLQVAEREPMCLEEPAPVVWMQDFADSSVTLLFHFWSRREHHVEVRNTLLEAIKQVFDREGIEIPFPQLNVTGGAISAPLRVQMVTTAINNPDAQV